jgi:hypothetical protein
MKPDFLTENMQIFVILFPVPRHGQSIAGGAANLVQTHLRMAS